MATRRQVEEAASNVGLHVAYYNPGDNPSYVFTRKPMSYFAISESDRVGGVRGGASAALLWLEGYAAGRSNALAQAYVSMVEGEHARKRRGVR